MSTIIKTNSSNKIITKKITTKIKVDDLKGGSANIKTRTRSKLKSKHTSKKFRRSLISSGNDI